jgi:integrase
MLDFYRNGRKKCPDCYYQAVAPPSIGRRSLGTFRTKDEADAALRRALTDHERGIELAPRKTTVAQIAERFFKTTKPDLAPATFARYDELWTLHIEPTVGRMLAANVRPAHIAELYAKLRTEPITYRQRSRLKTGEKERKRVGKPLSANSVLRIHRFLHRFFGWARGMNLVARNVIDDVPKEHRPKPTKSPARPLSPAQVVQLLKAAEETRLQGFFVTAAMTGMRRGEFGALTWDAVDLEKGEAIVRQAIGEDRRGGTFVKSTKSGCERIVPLNSQAITALHALSQRAGVGEADQSRRLRRPRPRVRRRARRCSGPRHGQQDLREAGAVDRRQGAGNFAPFAASRCRDHGTHRWSADVRTVSSLLGHASPSTTLNVYGHAMAGAKERAVSAIGDALSLAEANATGGESLPA